MVNILFVQRAHQALTFQGDSDPPTGHLQLGTTPVDLAIERDHIDLLMTIVTSIISTRDDLMIERDRRVYLGIWIKIWEMIASLMTPLLLGMNIVLREV